MFHKCPLEQPMAQPIQPNALVRHALSVCEYGGIYQHFVLHGLAISLLVPRLSLHPHPILPSDSSQMAPASSGILPDANDPYCCRPRSVAYLPLDSSCISSFIYFCTSSNCNHCDFNVWSTLIFISVLSELLLQLLLCILWILPTKNREMWQEMLLLLSYWDVRHS